MLSNPALPIFEGKGEGQISKTKHFFLSEEDLAIGAGALWSTLSSSCWIWAQKNLVGDSPDPRQRVGISLRAVCLVPGGREESAAHS